MNTDSLVREILEKQDENGCWNVLKPGDKYYPDCQYYCPAYKSTLWTLIFLAEIGCRNYTGRMEKPLRTISDYFYDRENGIFTIGKSHFPIPCLNGNMLYLLSYYGFDETERINNVINFFAEYQRFDDGDFKTPKEYPYFNNRSCYGKHTCYWGVIKLLKGLSFLPESRRTANARELLRKCIGFVLLHQVCYSSRNPKKFLRDDMVKLTFPLMYRSDMLEILWLLKRECVIDKRMNRSLEQLKSRMLPDGTWKPERTAGQFIVPFGGNKKPGAYITRRAKEVLKYYANNLPDSRRFQETKSEGFK